MKQRTEPIFKLCNYRQHIDVNIQALQSFTVFIQRLNTIPIYVTKQLTLNLKQATYT